MKKNIILLLVVLLGLSWYTLISSATGDPEQVQEHLQRAEELEKKEIYVDAVQEYQAALELVENDPEISMKMAKDYLLLGQTDQYVTICQNTAEMNQNDTKAMDQLMKYYDENGYEGRAVDYLKEFVAQYPDNENAQKWFLKFKGSYTNIYCEYEELSPSVNGTMVVSEEGKYGIATADGNTIIPAAYKEAYPFSAEGFALVVKPDGKSIYIDTNGYTRKVPDPCYSDLGMISEGRVIACKDGKYGYLNEDMEEHTKFQWEALTAIKNKMGAAKYNGKWAVIGKNGKGITEYVYEDVIMDENRFCSGQGIVFVKENGSYHMVDEDGEKVGKETFDHARVFSDQGYAAVCKGEKWGFADAKGNMVIDCTYEDAYSFSNGFAAVKVDDHWTYIDEQNHVILSPGFAYAAPLSSSGTAPVKIWNEDGEEWQLIQLNLFR